MIGMGNLLRPESCRMSANPELAKAVFPIGAWTGVGVIPISLIRVTSRTTQHCVPVITFPGGFSSRPNEEEQVKEKLRVTGSKPVHLKANTGKYNLSYDALFSFSK